MKKLIEALHRSEKAKDKLSAMSDFQVATLDRSEAVELLEDLLAFQNHQAENILNLYRFGKN